MFPTHEGTMNNSSSMIYSCIAFKIDQCLLFEIRRLETSYVHLGATLQLFVNSDRFTECFHCSNINVLWQRYTVETQRINTRDCINALILSWEDLAYNNKSLPKVCRDE